VEIVFNQKRSAQIALGVGCIVVAALYGWFATRAYLATRLAMPPAQLSLQRAIALEPADAAYPYMLGQYLMLGMQDVSAAVAPLKRATELNSYDSSYWLDLALAYYEIGAESKQRQAINKAIAVDPTSPVVAWKAANFFLVQGDLKDALAQFAIVLRNDPGRVMPSLQLCWRTWHNVDVIESILPPDPNVYLQFVKMLSDQKQPDAAFHVWSALWSLNRDFDYRNALFYVDRLIQQRDVARASLVWKQLASRSPTLRRYSGADNLVADGTFSEEILNAGFAWRYDARPGIAVSLDTTQFHGGSRSLMIVYSDSGDDAGLYQYVPVEPNTRYVLSAWVKSEELESANGPRVSVSDAYDNTAYGKTDETVGTTVWHRVDVEFHTGPATQLVAIRFVRSPGNTLIRGQFWADEIALKPASSSPTE